MLYHDPTVTTRYSSRVTSGHTPCNTKYCNAITVLDEPVRTAPQPLVPTKPTGSRQRSARLQWKIVFTDGR